MPGDIQEVNAAVLISSVLDVVSGPILCCTVESNNFQRVLPPCVKLDFLSDLMHARTVLLFNELLFYEKVRARAKHYKHTTIYYFMKR